MKRTVPAFQLFFDREFVAEIPLTRSSFVIGRKAGCHLRLIDLSVSREHCRITVTEEGAVEIEDLSSTNGTILNGRRILKGTVQTGNSFGVGRCTLVFHELDPEILERAGQGFFSRIGRRRRPEYAEPRGSYVLPRDDSFTEFDGVAFTMTDHQAHAEDQGRARGGFIRRVPRLQVVAREDSRDREVTRFSVSATALGEDVHVRLRGKGTEQPVFAQPEIRGRRFRLPLKAVEWTVIPLALIFALVLAGRTFLTAHIETELDRAEHYWNQELERVAERYRYADDHTFSPGRKITSSKVRATRTDPLSVDEVWRRIDAAPLLRNHLLFEVLDQVLSAEELAWSIEDALRNVSRLDSVTRRLPSLKKLQVLLASESAAPLPLPGAGRAQVIFLSDRLKAAAPPKSYDEYKRRLVPRLDVVSGCAGSRDTVVPGKVVLAFTVGRSGEVESVYVNQERSSREPALWKCVKARLESLSLDAPPDGAISIVYTFKFGGPTRLDFEG